MPQVRPEFGEAVRRVLSEQGLTLRGASLRTGLNHVTVMNMTNGVVPRSETVLRFARGFGLHVNHWLELAGYEPLDGGAEERADALMRLIRRYAELQGQYPDKHFPIPTPDGGLDRLTPEEADSIMDDLADKLRRGVL